MLSDGEGTDFHLLGTPSQTELMVGGGRDKANNSINNNNRPMGVGREDRQPVLKFHYSLRTDVTATVLST